MRHYWHPVAAAAELKEQSVKEVKHLGEGLVLFRDLKGRYGLIDKYCAHRRVNLAYGIPEEDGLRCCYHGWKYDVNGRCLEQPFEETVHPEGRFKEKCSLIAYPVQELGGLIFAYLGPQPAPLLPQYNVLVWDDAVRETNGCIIPCNWLQVMENLFDPLHVESLHGRFFAYVLERKGGDQLQEFLAHHAPAPVRKIAFESFEHGLISRYLFRAEEEHSWNTGDAVFFPTTSLISPSNTRGSLIFIVPIDDTHTWFLLHFAHRTGVPLPPRQPVPFFDVPGVDKTGKFITDTAHGQDYMAAVSPGAMTPRDQENLGVSDAGIVRYRELLREQMDLVSDGGEPINVHRDPDENQIIDLPVREKASGVGRNDQVVVP